MKAFTQRRSILGILGVLVLVGFLGFLLEFSIPTRSPKFENTYTPITQAPPQEVGSYDVMGTTVSRAEAEQLLQTETGKIQLAPENGAIKITDELIQLGRDQFYRETFGNEYFFTDVLGAIDGPLNLVTIAKAITALKGKATTNLQVPIDQDMTIGGRTFKAGTLVSTGLDVPAGSLIPLGMQTFKRGAEVQVGLTCALGQRNRTNYRRCPQQRFRFRLIASLWHKLGGYVPPNGGESHHSPSRRTHLH
jgi:hypothetical protein